MSNLWRTFFGFADDDENETYEHAVVRARKLFEEENYEDACRILRFAEANQNAEAMYLLGWCYWRGQGVAEDAARAVKLATFGKDGFCVSAKALRRNQGFYSHNCITFNA